MKVCISPSAQAFPPSTNSTLSGHFTRWCLRVGPAHTSADARARASARRRLGPPQSARPVRPVQHVARAEIAPARADMARLAARAASPCAATNSICARGARNRDFPQIGRDRRSACTVYMCSPRIRPAISGISAMRATMRAAALVALLSAVATTIDSSLECSSSEAAVGPFAYGAEPVPQQRCVARNARLSRNPLALHLFASNATERARLQRVWGDADTAVQFHQHVMNLPVLVRNESGPQPSPCAQQIDSALAISVPDLSNLYHVFFDLLAPLADTLLSLNRTLGVVHPRLIALHNPIATRAQPWLLPIRRSGYLGEPPAAVAAEYFLEGDSSGWNIEEEAPVDACRLAEGLGGKAYQFGTSAALWSGID
jgi:hypothetical protein